MRLVIDTTKGIAGDIVNAALLDLGADKEKMISSMEYAGRLLGQVKVNSVYKNKISKLDIELNSEYHHLPESKINFFLKDSINKLNIKGYYKYIALNILKVLCEAERYVHSHDEKLISMMHHDKQEAILHEAKDIIIDIIGLSTGLQELNINELGYLNHVNVGGGSVKFSHGEFDVPAPATEYILDKYNINWKKSALKMETATPTGVSILAGSGAKKMDSLKECPVIKKSLAQGTRDLEPVPFYLIK